MSLLVSNYKFCVRRFSGGGSKNGSSLCSESLIRLRSDGRSFWVIKISENTTCYCSAPSYKLRTLGSLPVSLNTTLSIIFIDNKTKIRVCILHSMLEAKPPSSSLLLSGPSALDLVDKASETTLELD